MSPLVRKVSIILAVVVLLVVAYFIGNSRGHRKFVSTSGRILVLSDTNPKNANAPDHPHIWMINADGSGAVRMPCTTAETDEDPSFSPDGSLVTFISDRKGSPQVWIMNGDGTDPEAVTIGNDAKSMPKFSPDGKHIAYISRGALTLVNLDTKAQEILLPIPHQGASDADTNANHREPVTSFAWAPVAGENGTMIAAVQDSDTGNETLTLVGGALAEPVPVASASNVSFTWAPDASHLLVSLLGVVGVRPPAEFLSKLPPGVSLAPEPNYQSAIYSFGNDGSLLETPPLAAMSKSDSKLKVGPQNPAISPDGVMVAFETWPGPNAEVKHFIGIQSVLTATGSAGTLRMNGPTAQPAFSDDGLFFGFTAPHPKELGWRDLITIHFDNGKVINLTNGHLNVLQFCISPARKKA